MKCFLIMTGGSSELLFLTVECRLNNGELNPIHSNVQVLDERRSYESEINTKVKEIWQVKRAGAKKADTSSCEG